MNVSSGLHKISRADILRTGALAAGCAFAGYAPLPAEAAQSREISKALVASIESIVHAKGTVDNGVLSIEIDRNDLKDVRWRGSVPFLPSFQINGTLVFQSLGGDEVMMNSDMALKTAEVDPFIDQLIRHDIVFQAQHQHFYDLEPDVWFIHFRARGSAARVAQGVKAALGVTSTPFPQAPPEHPKTQLPAEEIGRIIGAKPTVGADGVVNLEVPRRNDIVLGGVHVNPYLNVETPIAFQPHGGGRNAVAVCDYGMIASEIQRVVGHMRSLGWDSGCLYNQETDEQPQLYFDHMAKTGDALQLAREIRSGLKLMDMLFKTP